MSKFKKDSAIYYVLRTLQVFCLVIAVAFTFAYCAFIISAIITSTHTEFSPNFEYSQPYVVVETYNEYINTMALLAAQWIGATIVVSVGMLTVRSIRKHSKRAIWDCVVIAVALGIVVLSAQMMARRIGYDVRSRAFDRIRSSQSIQ